MKRLNVSILIFVFYNLVLYAQTNIDSLEKVLAGNSPDIEKVKALNILSYEYLFTDTKKADICMNKLAFIAESTREEAVKAEAWRAMADQYSDMEDYSKAEEFYHKARNLFKSIKSIAGEIGYARTLLHMGIIPHIHGDFNEAILLYTEAEPILLKNKQHRYLINLYNRITDVYEQQKNKDKAMIYVLKAIKLSEELHDPENLVRSLFTYTANSGNSAKNIEYLKKAYTLIEKHKLPDWLKFYYHFNYGGELYKLKRYEDAYQAYEMAESLGFDMREKMGPMLAKINILLDEKRINEAEVLTDSSMVIAGRLNLKVQVRDLYALRTKLDSIRGDFKNAYLFTLKRIALNDSLLTEETQIRVDYLQAKYQSVQKESKIIQLQDEKKIQQIWIFSSVGGVILLIVSLVFIYLNYKKKQLIANQQIEQLRKEKQLEATLAVLEGETTERTRVSRELHDGLGGLLSGTKLVLNNMKGNVLLTEEHVNQFDHALSLLDNSINELRRVAYNMMPENLHHFGLKKALEEFCRGLNKGTGTSVRFSFFGEDSRFVLNSEVIIFRIAQELLNNALKHAEATEINISLVQEPDRLSMTIQDNGKGFDTHLVDENKSSGLRNIRSRVDSLGGNFTVYSEQGQGTEITIEIEI